MLKLFLKPEAENDLEKIYQYTFETWGVKQADKYQDELFEGIELILNNSAIGKKYPYSKMEYRKLHVNRHLVFYRIERQSCIVVRILHDCMDLKDKIERSDT